MVQQDLFRSVEIVKSLLQQKNYRNFLLQFFVLKKALSGSQYSYGVFSKKAGISSRSTIRDIAEGRRRITSSLMPKILKGLDLPYLLSRYFVNLVKKDEHDLESHLVSEINLEDLKSKILLSIEQKVVGDEIFLHDSIPMIFSCLGGGVNGLSIAEISQISGIDEKDLGEPLKIMEQSGLVISFGERYVSRNLHLSFSGGQKNSNFHRYLVRLFQKEVEVIEKDIDNPSTLFTFFNTLVLEEDFANIKSDLLVLLERFFEEHENKNGDKALKFILGMHF